MIDTEKIEEEAFFDPWMSEGLFFAEDFLSAQYNPQVLVEQALLDSAFSEVQPNQRRAVFFKTLEKLSIQRKVILESEMGRQMELFDENVGKGIRKHVKEARICRARAHLLGLPIGQRRELSDRMKQGLEVIHLLVPEFSMQLQEENADKDFGENNAEGDVAVNELLCRYLLGLLGEEEAMEVEKKCRQHPDWQRFKIWIGKVSEWIRLAVQSGILESSLGHRKLEADRKIKALDAMSADRMEGSPADSEEEPEQIPLTGKDTLMGADSRDPKERMTVIIFAVGLLASLIGYFGWIERERNLANDSVETIEGKGTLDGNGTTTDLPMDENWSRIALAAAQESAENALAQSTVSEIEKMEDSIKVPSGLLALRSIYESNLSSSVEKDSPSNSGIPTKDEESPVKEGGPSKNLIQEALNSSQGYLFVPDREALGRVKGLRAENGRIVFKRADWKNPDKSYGLAVADYELRMDTLSDGRLIVLGEVKPLPEEIDANASRRLYELQPVKAWWLDRNETRYDLPIDQFWD